MTTFPGCDIYMYKNLSEGRDGSKLINVSL